MTVFMDKGFKSPMHAVDSFTVEAKSGTQVFEVFGNVLDFPGVDPAPVREDEDPYGIETHFKYRFITLQNCSPLQSPSDTPVNNQDWVVNGDAHYVRADDQWIDAWGEDFGKENWLKLSHAGSYHPTMDKPSVYKAVMKDTSYIVIERIEFDLPWKWPVAGTEYFVDNGEFTPASITAGVRSVATRAWRHSLSQGACEELDTLIGDDLANTENNAEALRNVLATVLVDARFLFLNGDHATQNQSARESAQTANFQRVSWLAAFLWRSVPDQRLLQLAHRGVAMEGFDATGKPRQRILKIVEEPKQMLQLPVDSATKIDGHAVHGMDDLKILLREKYTEDFARSFSSALMSFAIGRPLTYRDDDQLSEVTEHFQQHDYRMDELIKAIVSQRNLQIAR